MERIDLHLRDISAATTGILEPSSRHPAEQDTWLISFVDILTLVVTLFVVLLAYSQHRPDSGPKTQSASASAVATSRPTVRDHASAAPPRSTEVALVIPPDLEHRLSITRTATSVNFEIKDSVLFDVGSADLKTEGRALLARIAGVLTTNRYPIAVEGHTDNAPIHTARFPSNWELSTTRATVVTRFLIEQGIASERLRASGYAQTQPLADNTTQAGRARNRRVSLVVQLETPKMNY